MQRFGFEQNSNLFWSWYEPRNFGDWIGPYLYEHISGTQPTFTDVNMQSSCNCFFAAGSIMRKIEYPDRVTVWGSGIISENDKFERPKAVRAVRGPRTAAYLKRLGYPTSDIYGDPAILMPTFFKPSQRLEEGRIGIIPHYIDYPEVVKQAKTDVVVINVAQPVEVVVAQIAACEATASSSLHGLILSHAYSVPCAWIESQKPLHGDGVKFQDYYEAAGIMEMAPSDLGGKFDAKTILQTARSAPVPDLTPLVRPLLDACPFPRA